MNGEPKVRIGLEEGGRYLLIEGELWLLRDLLDSLRVKETAADETGDQLNIVVDQQHVQTQGQQGDEK